jgi:hypothetical protein
MVGIPRGPALKLLLNDLALAKRRADRLGLKIVASLIAMAVISIGVVSSAADAEDPTYLNDNQGRGPSKEE